jgi:hypothetical protein
MHASDKISRESLTKIIKRSFIMSDQAQVDSSDNSSALINDPVFSNLHNAFQGELVQNVIKFNQLNATINNTSQSGQTQGGSTTSGQPEAPEGNETPGNQTPTTSEDADLDPKNEAIQLLSINAISFLDTWDTYARETLYVRGGEDAQVNEIQLVAYEAGRAMASLSWGITTTIVPIENALNHPMNSDSTISKNANDDTELQQHLEKVWLNIFDDRSIASVQQQISALSTVMDDAFYRTHPNIQRSNHLVFCYGFCQVWSERSDQIFCGTSCRSRTSGLLV